MNIDYAAIPERVQIDLCASAIRGTMEALQTPEGRAVIERHLDDARRCMAAWATAKAGFRKENEEGGETLGKGILNG